MLKPNRPYTQSLILSMCEAQNANFRRDKSSDAKAKPSVCPKSAAEAVTQTLINSEMKLCCSNWIVTVVPVGSRTWRQDKYHSGTLYTDFTLATTPKSLTIRQSNGVRKLKTNIKIPHSKTSLTLGCKTKRRAKYNLACFHVYVIAQDRNG